MTAETPVFVCPDLRVRSLPRALRFYRRLGLTPVARGRMTDGTKVVWLRHPESGQQLELFDLSIRSPLYRALARRRPTESALIFAVRDARGLVRSLRRLGAELLREFDDGEVRLTFLRDPDGALIELVAWTDAARPGRAGTPMAALTRPPAKGRQRAK